MKLAFYTCVALLGFSLAGNCQKDSSLQNILRSGSIFFNKYNKRDRATCKQLKHIVKRDKVDTVIILLNRYMDVYDTSNIQRDNREYIIYEKKGECYVDYFYYPKSPSDGFKESIDNKFKNGRRLFDYYLEKKIDTVKSGYKFDNVIYSDELSEFAGYINVGTFFYNIGYVPRHEKGVVAKDPRAIFYMLIMKSLRDEGY